MDVAMKIQYPGVADSVESDIENVKLLLDYTNLIPEGLYLDRAMKVCSYACMNLHYSVSKYSYLTKLSEWLAFQCQFNDGHI